MLCFLQYSNMFTIGCVSHTSFAVCRQCNHKHQCFTCEPDGACNPLKHHQRLVVSQHGALQGRHQMKAEIYARGPITCGIMATAGLDAYAGALLGWSQPCGLFVARGFL